MRGGRAVVVCAVSELSVVIPSKSMQRPIVFENQGVVYSCGGLSDSGGKDLRGGRAVGGGAVSELSVVVKSKSMQGPIGLENEGV